MEEGRGATRDFSPPGVYFETDQSFSDGDPIEFFLILNTAAWSRGFVKLPYGDCNSGAYVAEDGRRRSPRFLRV
jgi:hypothetical protein